MDTIRNERKIYLEFRLSIQCEDKILILEDGEGQSSLYCGRNTVYIDDSSERTFSVYMTHI